MAANGLAKLIEECGELVQVAGKKLAYYRTDEHPDGNGSLKRRLEDEIADVRAACAMVTALFGLDADRIQRRAETKEALFTRWHRTPGNNADGIDADEATS